MEQLSVNGTVFSIGDKYKECDSRFERFVTITGFDKLNKRIQLNNRTWAMAKRFNGKHGGYILVAKQESTGSATTGVSAKGGGKKG